MDTFIFAASRRGWRSAHDQGSHDYAFEMACSNIRYGPRVTQEVGMVKSIDVYGSLFVLPSFDKDLVNMNIKKVAVFTDKNVSYH